MEEEERDDNALNLGTWDERTSSRFLTTAVTRSHCPPPSPSPYPRGRHQDIASFIQPRIERDEKHTGETGQEPLPFLVDGALFSNKFLGTFWYAAKTLLPGYDILAFLTPLR